MFHHLWSSFGSDSTDNHGKRLSEMGYLARFGISPRVTALYCIRVCRYSANDLARSLQLVVVFFSRALMCIMSKLGQRLGCVKFCNHAEEKAVLYLLGPEPRPKKKHRPQSQVKQAIMLYGVATVSRPITYLLVVRCHYLSCRQSYSATLCPSMLISGPHYAQLSSVTELLQEQLGNRNRSQKNTD